MISSAKNVLGSLLNVGVFKFSHKKMPMLNIIVLLHIIFSVGFMLLWTFVKRGGDFSVTFCPAEEMYIAGNIAWMGRISIFTSALFRYLHFSHLAFYLFNTFLSSVAVIIFYKISHIHLEKRLSIFTTAIFAFNPAVIYYNNFILKETILMLIIVSAMYAFFKAQETDMLQYKIILLLLLPLLLTREPFCLMSLLLLAFLSRRKIIIIILSMAVILLIYMICQTDNIFFRFIRNYLYSHLGNYGATKIILQRIYGRPTIIVFSELFTTPLLFTKYICLSIWYYIRPGMYDGIKLNCVLIPYDLFFYFLLLKSFRFRKSLRTCDKISYFYIALVILLISLVFIIYDPHERYRDSVTPLLMMLLVLNFKGWQKISSLRNISGSTNIRVNLIL